MRLFKICSLNSFKANKLTAALITAVFVLSAALAVTFVTERKLAAENAPALHLGDPLPENLFVELARVINPSVVNISSTYMPKRQFRQAPLPFNDPFFQMFQNMFPWIRFKGEIARVITVFLRGK